MSDYLDQAAERIDAATEGPWEVLEDSNQQPAGCGPIMEQLIVAGEDAVLDWGNGTRKADAEFIAHAREDLPRLLAAVRAVEAVHEPIDALNVRINRIQKVCTGCGTDDGNWQVWPCPTIRAITEALEGER